MLPAGAVVFAYRLLLGREPESEATVAQWRRLGSLSELAVRILTSTEGRSRWGDLSPTAGGATVPPEVVALFQRHARQAPAAPGQITNFLGVTTRVAFLPEVAALAGHVEGMPIPCNFHGGWQEWMGALRSVEEAATKLIAVELGAGWGPWLVSAAVAARHRGITEVELIGVEADPGKLAMLRTHLEDNGIDPSPHRLVAAAISAADGVALFPVLTDPAADWGAAVLDAGRGAGASKSTAAMTEVPAVSLQTLLAGIERVDLLHCDIQGDEVRVLSAGFEVVDRRVRRAVIGTHGRDLEAQLFNLFAAAGWQLEAESPCRLAQVDRTMVLSQDGCQVWVNPRLAPHEDPTGGTTQDGSAPPAAS